MTAADVSSRFALAIQGISFKGWQPGQILDFLRNALIELLDDLDPSDLPIEVRQQIHDAVKTAFDSYIRPLDIPYVPAIAEPVIEDWVWSVICRELCRRLDLDHSTH